MFSIFRFKQLYIPWFIAVGFFFLFLSTFVINNDLLKTLPGLPVNTQAYPISTPSSSLALPLTPNTVGGVVLRVIDGDTVELSDGIRVRLIGIDTPESGNCYSKESTNKLKELVEGKNVSIEKDVLEKDKYGRLLAYLYINNTFVNENMVREGYAKILTIPPDIKYVEKFTKAQNEAREEKLGLWADTVCNSQLNSHLNSSFKMDLFETNSVNTQTNTDCPIKGNISSRGEKIYHTPGQRYYEKTKIEENMGERWFCSEKEAVEAGWRKSKV